MVVIYGTGCDEACGHVSDIEKFAETLLALEPKFLHIEWINTSFMRYNSRGPVYHASFADGDDIHSCVLRDDLDELTEKVKGFYDSIKDGNIVYTGGQVESSGYDDGSIYHRFYPAWLILDNIILDEYSAWMAAIKTLPAQDTKINYWRNDGGSYTFDAAHKNHHYIITIADDGPYDLHSTLEGINSPSIAQDGTDPNVQYDIEDITQQIRTYDHLRH